MSSFLGIDLLPDRVRGVLVRTQLRRVTIVAYAEVPIFADVITSADAIAFDPPTSPLGGTPHPLAPAWPGAPSPFGDAPPGAPSPFGSAALDAAPSTLALAPLDGSGIAAAPPEPGRTSLPSSPLSVAVAELFRRTGAGRNAEVVACLPGEHSSLRRVELPKAAEKKLEELLPFEMESLLPFDQADTLLDHQPIDSDLKHLRLLVCAATKSRIRETLDLLAGAGADPTELVPGAVPLGALATLVPALGGEGPHLIVSVRPSSTDVCVVKKARTELARTLSIGGTSLVMGAGGTPPADSGDTFVRELKQTLLSWRVQGGSEPESVFLAGDFAPGIVEWLSGELARTVLPLALPEPQPQPLGAQETAPRHVFATALGLALHATVRTRHLDLRKGDLEKRRTATFLRELAPILSVAAMAVACAFVFSVWARWSVLTSRRELLEDELARVTETRLGEETRSAARARRLLETGRRGDDPMPVATAYDILVSLSTAVPEGVAHDISRLSIDLGDARSGGRLEIQGTVGTIEEYDRVAEAIGEIECLSSLERGPLTNSPDGRRNYRIEADILCETPDAPADDEGDS